MNIKLDKISKRFQYRYIIKDCELSFSSGKCYGIKGANGSGKSTLLKIIAGYLSPSSGEVVYSVNNQSISRDDLYQYLSFAAPYTDLIDEMTLGELLAFYQQQKKMFSVQDHASFCEILGRDYEEDMYLGNYSSGMYQRVRLGLALLTDVPLVLLDEPTSYLDTEAKQWFFSLLEKYHKDRTVIICSNEAQDFEQAKEVFDVGRWG